MLNYICNCLTKCDFTHHYSRYSYLFSIIILIFLFTSQNFYFYRNCYYNLYAQELEKHVENINTQPSDIIQQENLQSSKNDIFYKYLTTFGKYGDKPDEFNNPKAMAFSPNKEYLAVCDTENHRVIVYKVLLSNRSNSSSTYIFLSNSTSSASNNINSTLNANNALNSSYLPSSSLLSSKDFDNLPSHNLSLNPPFSEFLPKTPESESSKPLPAFIPQIIFGGTWSRVYLDPKSSSPAVDFYSYPQGIAWIDNNTLLIADTENHRLKKVNLKGEVLAVIGREGWKDGYFHQPLGVAVDSDQNIYVVEPRSKYIRELSIDFGQRLRVQGNRLQVLDQNGKCIKRLGHMHRMCGRRNRQFKSPTRVCVTNDYVFVADNGNHRILVFDKNLNFYKRIEKWKFYQLRYPNGVNVSEDGFIAIADTGNSKIVILDQNFDIFQILEYSSSPANKFIKPFEAHFGTYGYLYVLDTKNSCIHVFAK